jgi:hypothetical protein
MPEVNGAVLLASAVRQALRPGDCLALDGGEFARWARWAVGG